MTLYVIITLLVAAGPVALSFDRRVAFHTHWKELIQAIIPVSALYLIWDVVVTERGHWAFNPRYSGEITILGLPLGEWLFFLVVPYACIFIYEVLRAYTPAKELSPAGRRSIVPAAAAAALLFILLAAAFRGREYTLLAMLSVSLWLIVTLVLVPQLFFEIHTLWYFLLSTVAFMLVNGILTAVPIVTYNPEAIWGIRLVTIPLEDLFYNISLLGLYLTLYRFFSRRRRLSG